MPDRPGSSLQNIVLEAVCIFQSTFIPDEPTFVPIDIDIHALQPGAILTESEDFVLYKTSWKLNVNEFENLSTHQIPLSTRQIHRIDIVDRCDFFLVTRFRSWLSTSIPS